MSTLSTEEVCGLLAAAGVDESVVGRVFSARLQPLNLGNPDAKFCLGVPSPGGQAFLVLYKFGKAIGAETEHWTPQWLSVEGPFPVADIPEKSKELTA